MLVLASVFCNGRPSWATEFGQFYKRPRRKLRRPNDCRYDVMVIVATSC